jgi:hypothetical protein
LVYEREIPGMKLTAGEIYFVGERDLKTSEITTYVKIGIVREGAKGPRTSAQRLDEHQTGNPRQLFIHEVIETPAVEEIETRLHKAFAQYGVSGEWFQYTPDLLQSAIAKAKELRDEAKASIDALILAEELKRTPANGETIDPTDEVIHWHAKYVEASEIIKVTKRLRDEFETLIESTTENLEEVDHILTKQVRAGATYLDTTRLEFERPDIYGKYLVSQESWYQRFKVAMPKAKDYSLIDHNPMAWEVIDFFGDMLQIEPESAEDREVLHAKYLELLGLESEALWEKQLAEGELKAHCSSNQAIEGICTWPREAKHSLAFDEDSFREQEPEIYGQYLAKREDVEVTLVEAKKGY